MSSAFVWDYYSPAYLKCKTSSTNDDPDKSNFATHWKRDGHSFDVKNWNDALWNACGLGLIAH